jgi:pimeloyl-ACP methyl ester carboxylesterase
MARSALAAADELGWDRFAVLGHSMGGATAIRVATLAPERVTAVAALTPVSPGGSALGEEGYASFLAAWADPGPALGSLAPHLSEDQLRNIVARSRATMDRAVWESYLANWTGASFIADVGSYAAPTTVTYGDSDPFVTADYLADTVARLRAGRLVRIESAGHYPMVEQPEATVRLWEEALMNGADGARDA